MELGSVADCESPSQRRAGAAERTADFYIKDTLIFLVQSCVGAAVLLVLPAPRAAPRLPRNATRLSAPPLQAGVFALHGAIRSHQDSFASAAAHARAPRHKWAGTQAVSNNVRLEAERTWLDKSRDAYVRGDAPPDETGIAVPVPPPAQPHLRGKSLMTLVSAARPPSSPPPPLLAALPPLVSWSHSTVRNRIARLSERSRDRAVGRDAVDRGDAGGGAAATRAARAPRGAAEGSVQ